MLKENPKSLPFHDSVDLLIATMEYCKEGSSYYNVLGVSSDSNVEEIKRAYRKLAMQWHPDRWTNTPSLLGEAKHKFQQIQEAYSGMFASSSCVSRVKSVPFLKL